MSDRIETLHPELGKKGVNILRRRYDTVHRAILTSISAAGAITFRELTEKVRHRIETTLDGSVTWYVTTVKLDLEARGEIERIPHSRPQRLRLTQVGRDILATHAAKHRHNGDAAE